MSAASAVSMGACWDTDVADAIGYVIGNQYTTDVILPIDG